MHRQNYDLWKSWHLGLIDRELSEEEKAEIKASDFAMHLLLPSAPLLQIINNFCGYERVLNSEVIIEMISRTFVVDRDVVVFKINDLRDNENNNCKRINKK